jgi:sodium/proline symporter
MNSEGNFEIFLAFALYLIFMMCIGLYYSRRQKSLSQYILGDRSLGPWVTSLSAEASDMSGWMLMGLPGYAYLHGLSAFWTASGLIVGTWLNWVLTARRLRTFTEVASNSLTIPDYLSNRFEDHRNILRFICAIFIIVFFIIYTSSGFVAAGKLFNTIFNISYGKSLFIGAFVVVFYTFLGGFGAVAATDFVQGTMMFFTVLYIPIAATIAMGGTTPTLAALSAEGADFFSLLPPSQGALANFILFLSCFGWGLGYFGQPHILVRFMAISNPKDLKKSTHIAMSWVIISLMAAIAMGIIGRAYLTTPLHDADAERVFIIMSKELATPFFTGIIWSAILAAIMSTASSQLLVTASAVARDLYQPFIHKEANQIELLNVSRITVLVIAGISLFLASDPNSYIFQIVSYAWAGFGACFGPAILLSLYWKRMTLKGAYAGVLVGGFTVLIWRQFAWFDLYELVPGFVFSMAAIIIVSLLDKAPSQSIQNMYDEFLTKLNA